MDLAYWRDIALVVLAIEALIFGLIPLVLFALAVRGVRWLDRRVHAHTTQAREKWQGVHERVTTTMSRVRAPFERVEAVRAWAREFTPADEDDQ